jgi:hypothetical protein
MLSAQLDVADRQPIGALIHAIQGASERSGVVFQMQFDVQRSEHTRIVSRDLRCILRTRLPREQKRNERQDCVQQSVHEFPSEYHSHAMCGREYEVQRDEAENN